jgi:hypothetical protein
MISATRSGGPKTGAIVYKKKKKKDKPGTD